MIESAEAQIKLNNQIRYEAPKCMFPISPKGTQTHYEFLRGLQDDNKAIEGIIVLLKREEEPDMDTGVFRRYLNKRAYRKKLEEYKLQLTKSYVEFKDMEKD